jgi:class 3 adenylate cyclase/tetratricopeptide (TPR) repeat protein
MQCPTCGSDNPSSNRFCGECGAALVPGCPSCGAANPPGKKFCGECGTSLASVPTRVPSSAAVNAQATIPAPSLASLVAERRVCSVLFCDLVGFTSLSEVKDPEEVRELLSRYFVVARTVIGRYGGVVEKFIGDAVMAVWGTPTATEEDAERAVRAGLDLVEAVAHLGAEAGADGLCARAGVVTGPVAVTVGAAAEGMVAGDAVNTAARVQTAAKPGAVYVDEGTWRVARAAVAFTPAGEHAVKGKAEPVTLWQAGPVLSGVGGAQRHDGLEAPFVGRDTELRLVKELFHACVDRRTPRLVSVSGVAGVGKSRLGWEFEKYVDGLVESVAWHRGRCLSYGEGVAFWALAEMVRQRLAIAEEDRAVVVAEKLAAGLEQWFGDPAEREYVSARLGQLLGIAPAAGGRTLPREELFAGWRLFFERLASTSPVVLMVEDLQNADPGFLDFLEHLLDWARDVPVFVLTLARPDLQDRRPGWGTGRRNGTAMTLDALDAESIDALLDGLVPGMPAPARAAVAERAEGVPLYAVETVRMLVDRDVVQPKEGVYRLVGDLGELGVPATLQSLLAARLDALDPAARSLVADAAVLGSSFPAEALVAVSGLPEAEVRRQLAELLRREVLGVRADPLSPEQGHYGFVQTMFRQVAYDTLARRERKARHLAVAAYLRSAFDDSEEISEVIAAHLLSALHALPDDPDAGAIRERSVTMLNRAAERAERTGAPLAAAAAYDKAADLLLQIATEEAEQEAAVVREHAGMAAGAGGDPHRALAYLRAAADLFTRHGRVRDVARVTTRQAEQFRAAGQPEQGLALLPEALAVLRTEPDADTVKALEVLALLEPLRGNDAAAELASAEALALAQDLDLPDATLAQLFITRGIGHGFAGRHAQALANVREGLRLAERAQDNLATSRALLNLGDVLLTTSAREAAEASRSAGAQARRRGNPYMLSNATCNLMQALLVLGEWDEIEHVYAMASDLEGADSVLLAYGVVLLRSFRGDTAGLAPLLPAMEQWQDAEDPQDASEAATALAAAAACSGDHAGALRHAEQALAHAPTLGTRHDGVRWAWSLAAEAAFSLGRPNEVGRLLEWLDDRPPGQIPRVLRAERMRFRARSKVERNEPAAAAFDEAITALREVGSPYHLAVGLLDSAEHLVATRSVEAAALRLAEAQAIALGLGAAPLLERAGRIPGVSAEQRVAAHFPA